MEKIKTETEWYDNPNLLTNIILGVIVVIIIMSQAFAVNNNLSSGAILRNILNHNLTYIIALIYFIFIKTKVGQSNFNLLNIIYILLYGLFILAATFTVFQSFGLSSLTSLILNIIVLAYMIYTFLPSTRLWNELSLHKVPFDEIKNEYYFYIITIISSFLLVVNLIGTTNFDGVVLTLFDAIYTILFARYIYLYKKYQEEKIKKLNTDKEVTITEDDLSLNEDKKESTEDATNKVEKKNRKGQSEKKKTNKKKKKDDK